MLLLVLLAGCSSGQGAHGTSGAAAADSTLSGGSPGRTSGSAGGAQGEASAPTDAQPTGGSATTSPPPSQDQVAGGASPDQLTGALAQDRVAGVLSHDVPQVGDGVLHPVPGTVAPPGAGTLRRLRVSVEGGLPVDGEAFARFVMSTLNDPRSWAHDGYTFSRTDGAFDTEVVLASPDTSSALCGPLGTMGTLSCRTGNRVVLTWYRWVNGQEDFGDDLTAYREYLVNHEVGHSLGHGHAACPGPGQVAPVMMQQTKGVKPCLPNAWPYP